MFTISGVVFPQKQKDSMEPFTGHMNVQQYPISLEDGVISHSGYVTKDYIHIRNQSLRLLNPEADRCYIVYILRTNPEVIVIEILENDRVITAVCGETEEEAIVSALRWAI